MPGGSSRRLLFTECFDYKQTGRVQTAPCSVSLAHRVQMRRFWRSACNHLSISHTSSSHPCHGRKLTRFDTALLPDWSVIGTLHLFQGAQMHCGWSPDMIISSLYFNPARGKLTNNTRISHCFYHYASTFVASLARTHTDTRAAELIDWGHLLVRVAPDSLWL